MEDRYSRQILFAGIGKEGQAKLQDAGVVVIGCGALGSVSCEILARAGIGTLTIVDRDFVEWSNLQRQSLFTEEDARKCLPKAVAAERALKALNSSIKVSGIVADVTHENIGLFCDQNDVLVDGSDNFEVRFLMNDYSVKTSTPWVYGAALGSYGISFAVLPGETACLRCFYPEPPSPGSTETCETAGILAPVTHIVSSYQTSQVLRLLVGATPSAKILQFDVWNDSYRTVSVRGPLDSCSCCGKRDFSFLEGRRKSLVTELCGRGAVQLSPRKPGEIDLAALARRLRSTMDVSSNDYLLKATVGKYEIVLFRDGRAIIKGTDEPAEARTVFSKYVGN
jgi:adenylyltransferase/sulfurtransferase